MNARANGSGYGWILALEQSTISLMIHPASLYPHREKYPTNRPAPRNIGPDSTSIIRAIWDHPEVWRPIDRSLRTKAGTPTSESRIRRTTGVDSRLVEC
jgi:hypothetical protein